MKQKLFSIFCCLLLSASMVTQAQNLVAENIYSNDFANYSGKISLLKMQDSENFQDLLPITTTSRKNAVAAYEWDAAFSYSRDVVSTQRVKDGTSCSTADINPLGTTFLKIKAYSSTISKGIVFYFCPTSLSNDLRYYDNLEGPASGNYDVSSPKMYNFGCALLWQVDANQSTNIFVGYGYNSYYGYFLPFSSYVGSYSNNSIDAEYALNGGSVSVAEGHSGKMFLEATSDIAHFTIGERKYTYNVNVATNNASLGTVSKNKSSVTEGGSVTLTATETSGIFQGWSLDGGTTIIAGTNNQLTYTPTLGADAGADGDTFAYTAVFAAAGGKYRVNYGVSPSGAGSITQHTYGTAPGTSFNSGAELDGGTSITLAANNNSGWRFDKWSNNATTPSITFTLSKDTTLTAQFIKTWTISTTCEDESGNTTNNGSISGGGTKDNDSTCTLTASSTLNYYFKKWKDNNSTIASRTFTVSSTTAAPTYTAVFAAREVVNITANGAQTKDGDNWYAEGVSESGYTVHLYFDSNNELNTTNSWIEKDNNRVSAQNISVATVTTTAASATLHIEATVILNNDTKKYVIVGDYDKAPLWGDFKFGRDEITLSNFIYEWWEPVSSVRIYAIQGIKSGTTDNYVWLCFKLSATSTYNEQVGPQSGRTYPVVKPVEDGFWANPNGGNYWLWRFPNGESDAMVGWGDKVTYGMNNSYYDYPCSVSSYFGDYVDDEDITAKQAFNGKSAIVEKGKDGNIYVQIVDNEGNRYVTIGEPAQPYTLAWDANGKSLTGGTAAGSVNEWTSITAPTSNTPGYTVSSWLPAFTGTMPSNDVTYVAQWSTIPYDLTYEGLEGATNSSNPTSYNIESETITLADPGTRDGYIFAGWKDESDNAITEIAHGSTGNRTLTATWTKATTLDLYDNKDATYYNNIKDLDEKTYDVTLYRTFKPGRWSTICLPFDYYQAQMEGHPLKGNINEYLYSEGNATSGGSGLTLYFKSAKSIEAGKPYLVYNTTGDDIVNLTFAGVTIDTDLDTKDADIDYILSKFSYKQSGSISLVGTFRKIKLPEQNHAYMGLMYDETAGKTKIYYPGTNANVPAYRAFFHIDDATPAQQRVRIVVDGVDMGEMLIDNGEIVPTTENLSADRAPRKYIRNGVLVIERNGVTYDAQGKKL